MARLGGIVTEVLRDVFFHLAPLERRDALEMMMDIKTHKIVGVLRDMDSVDLDKLIQVLTNRDGGEGDHKGIKEIDLDPVTVADDRLVTVDSLIILERGGAHHEST